MWEGEGWFNIVVCILDSTLTQLFLKLKALISVFHGAQGMDKKNTWQLVVSIKMK